MITVLSPAKTLNYKEEGYPATKSPQFKKKTAELIDILKTKSQKDIMDLMHIKEKLGALNYERYQQFSSSYTAKNSRSAISAFQGDVYVGLDAKSLSDKEITYAQDHVRILSGLYGLLRPLDRMQAYRLEMGTKLANNNGKDLYDFWGDDITKSLNKELKKHDSKYLINLASQEYFGAVNRKLLVAPIIDIAFKEERNGKLKFISFNAKKARGMMTRYIVQNQINDIEGLKGFDTEGYNYDESLSSDNLLTYIR